MIHPRYLCKHLARSFLARPYGSLFTLLACTLAIAQLAITVYIVDLARQATLLPVSASSMIAYLKDKPPPSVLAGLKDSMRRMEGVSRVEFIPRRAGLERMKQWLGPDNPLVEDLDPEVLPDAFEILLKQEYLIMAPVIAGKIKGLPEIEDVRYNKGLMGRIASSYKGIRSGGILIAALITLSLGLIVFLSIRIKLLSRGQEIEILGILGADAAFLYAPYVVEALLLGITGGILGSLAARAAINAVLTHMTLLEGVIGALNMREMVVVIGFAALCSLAGALIAIKR